LAEVAAGPRYKVYRWKDYPAGAGEINMAVEDAVRAINRANSAISAESNVWEISECIDEYYKPEPEAKISSRCGLTEDE
jgi:methionine aminopeptidase